MLYNKILLYIYLYFALPEWKYLCNQFICIIIIYYIIISWLFYRVGANLNFNAPFSSNSSVRSVTVLCWREWLFNRIIWKSLTQRRSHLFHYCKFPSSLKHSGFFFISGLYYCTVSYFFFTFNNYLLFYFSSSFSFTSAKITWWLPNPISWLIWTN